MRVLEFKVDQQRLSKQPGCDFSGIVAKSAGYLKVKFNFSDDWTDCIKQAVFWYGDEQKRTVSLGDQDECMIPSVVLTSDSFEVSVKGGRDSKVDYYIETNKFKVKQTVV